MPAYRFKFQIVDETSGDIIESDFCGLIPDSIDQFGGEPNVDLHVASMLRAFKKHGRAEYEEAALDAQIAVVGPDYDDDISIRYSAEARGVICWGGTPNDAIDALKTKLGF